MFKLHANSKSYIIIWIVLLFIVLVPILMFNLYMDPYWIIGHTNKYNRIQPPNNERILKSNFIAFNGKKEKYNAVLLGSSRATYFEETYVNGHKIFNYAANNMTPVEYPSYAEFFKTNTVGLEAIYLSVDFFGTRLPDYYEYRPPEYYLNSIGNIGNAFSLLISFDCLKSAIEILKANIDSPGYGVGYYDKLTRTHLDPPVPNYLKNTIVKRQIKFYREKIYGGNYIYNMEVDQSLVILKNKFPNVKFIVFTTPPTLELQALLFECGRLPDLEHWIRVLVTTFGQIHDFMGVNCLTSNHLNYRDAHHFYPSTGKKILEDISSKNPKISKLVTIENLNIHLNQQGKTLKGLANNLNDWL